MVCIPTPTAPLQLSKGWSKTGPAWDELNRIHIAILSFGLNSNFLLVLG